MKEKWGLAMKLIIAVASALLGVFGASAINI